MPSRAAGTAASVVLLFLLLAAPAPASAANFTCTTPGATCQSAIGYAVPNATTYAKLLSLFNTTNLPELLGANNLPVDTSATTPIPAKTTVRMPFRCLCSGSGAGGVGQSDRVPVYTVQPQDGLDAIARNVFDAFVTYQEIATANNISDPNKILIGQKVWIPLPCSCDQVEGSEVMHLAYTVAAGESTSGIAAKYGVDENTLLKLNNIEDPNKLQMAQILDVPLPVCHSSISDTSADHNLRLPNGTYALTAENCIQCRCPGNANNYQLECSSVPGKGCPAVPACSGNLKLGQTNGSGCGSTMCAYSGYSNSKSLIIETSLVTNQTACQNSGSTRAEFAGSMSRMLAVAFHMVLIFICFL